MFKDKILSCLCSEGLRVADEMLPITVKLAVSLKLELVNAQESHL